MSNDYGGHAFVDPDKWDKGRVLHVEQQGADKTNHPRLIHPHKYGERCGNLKHIRIIPFEAPVEVRVIQVNPTTEGSDTYISWHQPELGEL